MDDPMLDRIRRKRRRRISVHDLIEQHGKRLVIAALGSTAVEISLGLMTERRARSIDLGMIRLSPEEVEAIRSLRSDDLSFTEALRAVIQAGVEAVRTGRTKSGDQRNQTARSDDR